MDEKNIRVHYLDGFRGVACTTVLLSHFINCYLSSVLNLNLFYKIPFTVLFDGNVAVRYFFVLCGFTVAIQLFRKKKITTLLYKKYWRLMIPCLLANTIAFFLMVFGLYYNEEAAKVLSAENGHLIGCNSFEPNMFKMLFESLILDIFYPLKSLKSMYVSPLWTMSYEMIGSLAVCLLFKLLSLIKNSKAKRMIIVSLIIISSIESELWINTYFHYFFMGYLFADLYYSGYFEKKKTSNILTIILLLISSFFISSKLISINILVGLSKVTGEFLLLYLIFSSEMLKKLGNSKICSFLGKNSLGIYVIHWILYLTIISRIWLWLFELGLLWAQPIFVYVSMTIVSVGLSITAGVLLTKIIDYLMKIINNTIHLKEKKDENNSYSPNETK